MIQFTLEEKSIKQHSLNDVFEFLANANNHKQLLPSEITNIETTNDTCSFTLSKFGKFELIISNRTANSSIRIEPQGKSPIQFFIEWRMRQENETVYIVNYIEADVNPFIKLMAQKPLEDLMKYQMKKFTELFQ